MNRRARRTAVSSTMLLQ